MTRMLSDEESLQGASTSTRKILAILKSLRQSPEGIIIYNLVASMLQQRDRDMQRVEHSVQHIFDDVVNYCARHFPDNDGLNTRLQLLKTLAEPPASWTSIETLFREHAEDHATPNVAPLADTVPAQPDPVTDATGQQEQQLEDAGLIVPEPADIEIPDQALTASLTQATAAEPTDNLSELHSKLINKISGTSSQYSELTELMEHLLKDLHEAKSSKQLEVLRSDLQRKVRRMMEKHNHISEDIYTANDELRKFQSEYQQVKKELGEAKQMSMTDDLTGLPNRRAFMRRLNNETGRVQRYGYPLAVAMLDLDGFKTINDTHGHETGDTVLRCYTEKVLSTFRNYDLVARYGGEEFAVLLPHTDGKGAERALNKVRKRAQESAYKNRNTNQTLKLPTFSAGIAMYKVGEAVESLLDRADSAMYEAKRKGRNRVEISGG